MALGFPMSDDLNLRSGGWPGLGLAGINKQVIRGLNDLDMRVVTLRRSNLSVASDERRVEGFRESDVGGIVGGQIVAKLPHAAEKQVVRISSHGKFRQIV